MSNAGRDGSTKRAATRRANGHFWLLRNETTKRCKQMHGYGPATSLPAHRQRIGRVAYLFDPQFAPNGFRQYP
jgi:hypothetical protein